MVVHHTTRLLELESVPTSLCSILSKNRGEGLDSIVAKTLVAGGNAAEPDDEHEEMAKGVGLASYEGEHL